MSHQRGGAPTLCFSHFTAPGDDGGGGAEGGEGGGGIRGAGGRGGGRRGRGGGMCV